MIREKQEFISIRARAEAYLSKLSTMLRQLIQSFLEKDRHKYIYLCSQLEKLEAPELYQSIHKILIIRVKSGQKLLEKDIMYETTHNELGRRRNEEDCKKLAQELIGNFFANIIISYDYDGEYEYMEIVKHQYPDIYIQIN